MKNTLFLVFLLFISSSIALSQPELISKTAFTIGETVEIYSSELGEKRKLNIYLPLGYSADSNKVYPVIYLLDGSADEDIIHIAGIVQFASFPWVNIMPESIVVGIANSDRKRDFSFPSQNEKDKELMPSQGGSRNFINFIESELQPYIEANYKSNSVKTLIGQSLGGLLCTEILFKKPQLFDKYIIVSPSLWWDNGSLLNHTIDKVKNAKVYIAVGSEGEEMERLARELAAKLKDENQVIFEFFPAQDHGNILHLAVYSAFEKMFGKEK